MRAAFPYCFAFLAGVVASASVAAWLFSIESPEYSSVIPKPEAIASDSIRTGEPPEESSTVQSENEEESSEVRIGRMVEETLLELPKCDDQERAAHVSLLVSRLGREGAAGVEAMVRLMKSGENYSMGLLLKGRNLSVGGATSLQHALLNSLSQSADPTVWPVCRDVVVNLIRTAASPRDAEEMIRFLEKKEPGSHRAEAVAAILRLGNGSAGTEQAATGRFPALNVMAHYGAAELLPLVEREVLEHPAAHLQDFMGALWTLPLDVRAEVTSRALASEAGQQVFGKHPPIHRLDYRIPQAVEYAVARFQEDRPATMKAEWIKNLGTSERRWGTSYPLNNTTTTGAMNAPGVPGTPEQARVRLDLLSQISPYCPEPLLQERIEQARAALQEQLRAK
jgi:hypothetical protein